MEYLTIKISCAFQVTFCCVGFSLKRYKHRYQNFVLESFIKWTAYIEPGGWGQWGYKKNLGVYGRNVQCKEAPCTKEKSLHPVCA